MATLVELLGAATRRKQVVSDCVFLIDEEVKKKGGLSGMAIKMAFEVVKKVKPGFIPEAIDHMLDDFAARLDPFYQSHQKIPNNTRSLTAHLTDQAGQVADALLGITDDRAQRANNAMVKKSYEKLRPSAKKHVEDAVAGIGRLIEKHTAAATV